MQRLVAAALGVLLAMPPAAVVAQVVRRDGLFYGASDPRRPQAGSVGPAMLEALER